MGNDQTVGTIAPVAWRDREAIQRSTKEALAAAKARGVSLGNRASAALRRAGEDGTALRRTVRENADAFARSLIAGLRSEGVTSLRGIAEALNARGMMTRRGGRWHVSNVRTFLARLGTSEAGIHRERGERLL